MTLQEINQTYGRIIRSLDKKEIKNAFDGIQTLIAGSREYMFQDKLNELQSTYTYMLKYRIDGIKDPMQEQIYTQLLISSYELADQVKQKALGTQSPLSFYSCRRNMQTYPQHTFKQIHAQLNGIYGQEEQLNQEKTNTELFNRIWVSSLLRQEEAEEIREMLGDHSLPLTTSCQIVSALLLSLQEAFDKEKIQLLFDAASHPDEEVHVRALIALLIGLYTYQERIHLFPPIADRLETLAETPGFTGTIRTIILRFILARETEKITRKLQDEIIPEMIKLTPQLRNKINWNDISPEQTGEEMNPEWETLITDSRIGKKIEEFSELQQEGADVMHSTFTHLKNFPFFKEIANWFLPFSTKHSLLEGEPSDMQTLESVLTAAFMCNSDKYSLFFSMMQMPKEARDMMINQFDEQTREMLRQKEEELMGKQNRQALIAGQYIQDLYRFFKLYPGHTDFRDIFSTLLDFHNLRILSPYIADEESLTIIAEYYMRKNYFKDALTVFLRVAETRGDSHILCQKIGYCRQMERDMQGALEAYLRADLLHPESKWTIRRIAGCYRSLKQPEQALEYYRRYEALRPNELSIQAGIGHCYLELKNYSEALKYFFKIDYLDDKSQKAWRPIAWCSFLTGKYDQARNYYKKILDNKPTTQDFLNAGHTEWALQNIREALNCYQQAIAAEQGDFQKFKELFDQDIPDLMIAGIETEEIPLIMDELRYRIAGGYA